MKNILDNFKRFIKENYKILFIYLLSLFLCTYRLPYYVYTGGGVINTNDKIKINNEYKSSGKFNFAYVESRNAIIPLYLIAQFKDEWDVAKISSYKITDSDTIKDINFRDNLDLKISIANATINAYKLANQKIDIQKVENYIISINDKKLTNLQVGDIISKVENKDVIDIDDIREVIENKKIGDKVKFIVKRDKKELECYATIYEEDNKKIIGIAIDKLSTYEIEPKLEVKFDKSESGPSGGLMLALTIYDKLVKEDLTSGLNIVGTGTIDIDGNIGQIGGVKYKLQGAVKNKADVFIVSNKENYDEAIKLKKEKKYNIKIIGVDNLEDAINELKKIDKSIK